MSLVWLLSLMRPSVLFDVFNESMLSVVSGLFAVFDMSVICVAALWGSSNLAPRITFDSNRVNQF
jgi:hypothetical protein